MNQNDTQAAQVVHTTEPAAMLPIGPDSRPAALIHADPAAVAAAEMAREQIKLAYFMAVQSPRNQREAWLRILESCKRPTFAQKAIYSKPVGGSKIEGPSIRLAEAIIREWRNIIVRTSIVYEDDQARRVSILVVDLESNLQLCREIVTPKTVERKHAKDRDIVGERLNSSGERVFIVRATEDELANRESAAISKIVRNEGLRLIPADVVEDAIAEARRTRKQAAAQDPDFAIKRLVYRFGELRVSVADLERYLGAAIDKATPDQIDDLDGILQAITDRETTWSAVMEQKDAADPNQSAKTATEARGDALREKLARERAAGGVKGRDGGQSTGSAGADTSARTDSSPGNGPLEQGNAPAAANPPAQSSRRRAAAPAEPDPAPARTAAPARQDPEPEPEPAPAAGDDLADDPDRQAEAVGFAAVDLPDFSMAELTAHANRIRDLMDAGEKRTLRPAIERGDQNGVVAVLARVARREAAKKATR